MFNRGEPVIWKITGERGIIYSDRKAPVYFVRFSRKDNNGYPVTFCNEINEKDLQKAEEICAEAGIVQIAK